MLGSKEERTNGIRRQEQELIDQAYERGFKAGKEAFVTDEAKVVNEAYQKGLDDAWEVARKITCMWYSEQFDVFNEHEAVNIFGCNTASEAIAKIKAYEEQKKAEEECIKIGDEVVGTYGFRGIVVGIDLPSGMASVLNTEYTVPQMHPLDDLKRKTDGRHFPQIAEVLKQLQEGE